MFAVVIFNLKELYSSQTQLKLIQFQIFIVSMTKQFAFFLIGLLCIFNAAAQKAQLGIPTGHTGPIQTVCFSSDNRIVVSGGAEDKRIKFWDLQSGKVLKTYYEHKAPISSLAFNKNGNYLLSTARNGTAIIWDVNKDEIVHSFEQLPSFYLGAKFSPSGEQVASILNEQLLRIYDIETGNDRTLFGHSSPISAFNYNPNQVLIASGTITGKILIHNANTGQNLGELAGHMNTINDLKFSPDNTKLISTSLDNTCIVWDTQTGQKIHVFDKFKYQVYNAFFSPDSKYVLLTENNVFNEIWDIEKGVRIIKFDKQDVLTSQSCISPSGKFIFLSGNYENPPQLIDGKTFEKLHTLKTPADYAITSASFSYNEKYIAISFWAGNEILVFDCETGKQYRSLKGSAECTMSAKFNHAENNILVSSKGGSAIIWDIQHGKPVKFFNEHNKMVFASDYSPDEQQIITSSEDNNSFIYTLSTGLIQNQFPIYGTWENPSRYSYDGKYILSMKADYTIECRNAISYESLYQIKKDSYTELDICPTKNIAIVASPKQNPEIIELSKGNTLMELPNKGLVPIMARINMNGTYAAILYSSTYTTNLIKIWDLTNNTLSSSINLDQYTMWISFDHQGELLVYQGTNHEEAEIYHIKQKKVIQKLNGHEYGVYGAAFSADGSSVSTVSGVSKISLFNTNTGKLINRLDKHKNSVSFILYSLSGDYIITASWDGSFILWDGKTGDFLQQYYIFNNDPDNYMILIEDGYYLASKKASQEIYYTISNSIYPLEQFDLKFNRPDLVLAKTKSADSSLIHAYHSAYLKRLKKMGFTEDMLKDDIHLPEIKIENYEALPAINDRGSIDLKLNIKDSKYKLDRINIWVNDVAIYGLDGISLRDKNVQQYTTTLPVNLTKGTNKVQLSVLNQAGAESYKETFEIECSAGKNNPNLYLITIGASHFQDSLYNLTYAAKDANDFTNLMKNSKLYGEIYTKTLTNEQVTRENVMALKSFFEKADINDQVILFIAGHGVLDENLDYYFATYDMHFQNPAEKGIAYSDLEYLLDGIQPLKKTLMIDACHSGEIDKEEVILANTDRKEGENIQFRTVGKAVTPKLGMQNIAELTKTLFTDLRKGTGATVISSAGGMEFAMEGTDWKNGLFTFCLLNGIKSKAADLDNNGEIWLSEVQTYVTQQVNLLSNGEQQPSSRIENRMVDFRIW